MNFQKVQLINFFARYLTSSLAIKVGFISFAAVLLTVVFPARGTEVSSASALHGEAIPLIDAHSQVDCLVSKDLVMRQLERLRISRVLISVRGCRGWTTEQLEGRTLDWSKEHPDRISALVSTKVDGWSYASLSSGEVEALGRRGIPPNQ
jgi:hypothetical protein